MAAGTDSEQIGVIASNVTFHVKGLDRTGLVTARRVSRSIIYIANYDALGVLLRFLMEDRRGGKVEICASPDECGAGC